MARVWSLIKWATQVKSEGSQHAQIGIARSRSGLLPASPISISILDAPFYSDVFDRSPPYMTTYGARHPHRLNLKLLLEFPRERASHSIVYMTYD